jgi:hypothetical protein
MTNKKDYIYSLDFIKKLSSKKNGERFDIPDQWGRSMLVIDQSGSRSSIDFYLFDLTNQGL